VSIATEATLVTEKLRRLRVTRRGGIALASLALLAVPTSLAGVAGSGAHAGGSVQRAAGASLSSPSAATSLPRCSVGGLDIWLDTNADVGAGNALYRLELTNLTGHTCTLTGYPSVSAVNLGVGSDQVNIGSPASRWPTPKPTTVRLVAGATAYASLQIAVAYNYSAAACDLVTAAGVRVGVEGEAGTKLAWFPFPACKKTGPNILSVSAIQES
jgi:hypothetical protein